MSDDEALARAKMLAAETSAAEIPSLRARMAERVASFGGTDEAGRAERLADELGAMLDHADDLDDGGLDLLRGACEYFLLDDDFEAGLVDDARVIQAVREALDLKVRSQPAASIAEADPREPTPLPPPAEAAAELILEERADVFDTTDPQ